MTVTGTQDEGLTREILLLAAVVILGTSMTVLDLTVVNVAVPTLGREFGASISTIQWVVAGPGVEPNARPTSTSPTGDRRENRRSPKP
jgi:hypothetical protein